MLLPKSIVLLTRALISDARARRTIMFYLALAAILMVFVGAVLIDASLRAHPLGFLAYWGACAWLTLAAAFLAVFDILVVRAAGRAARRQLERDLVSHDHDPHAR